MKKLFGLLLVLCALSAVASVKAPGNNPADTALAACASLPANTLCGNSTNSPTVPGPVSSPSVSGGYYTSFSPTLTTYAGTPAAGTNAYGWSGAISGTVSGGYSANQLYLNNDTLVAGSQTNLVNTLELDHYIYGGFFGDATGLYVVLSQQATTANPNGDYAGGEFVAQLTANDNGVLGTPAGSVFGLNPNVRVTSAGTYINQIVGQENDVAAEGTALSGCVITGTAGQFTCTSTTLIAGQAVYISGVLGGTGSIAGYTSPSVYLISATNGTTTLTLTTVTGTALVTTTGTPTGLTYIAGASVSDVIGQQIVETSVGTIPGTRTNLGYSVNNALNVPGFDVEFADGAYSGYPGVSSTGTILGVWPHAQARPATGVSAGTAGCGVDFAGLCKGGSKAFTTAAYASLGFKVDPSGFILNSTAGGAVTLGKDAAGVYNGVVVTPGTTGNPPKLSASGVDAASALYVSGNGAGGVQLQIGNGGIGAFVDATSTATVSTSDYINLHGVVSGNNEVQIKSLCADTNIALQYITKGSGGHLFIPSTDGTAFQIQNAAKSNTYFQVNTSTGAVSFPQVATGTPTSFLCQASAGVLVNQTTPCVGGTLSGTTGSIGGSALLAGQCSTGTVSITGATTGMAVVATPVTYPTAGNFWQSYVSSAGVVTVAVCAAVADTPTASAYNVRVIQ